MFDKFEFYDLVGILVPGVLVVAAVPLSFPSIAARAAIAHFPDSFGLLALTALSVFVGYLIQTIASLIEPLLLWTWGGRPSEIAFSKGLGRLLPLETTRRIRAKLITATSADTSDVSLFIFAMQLADAAGSARVKQFNALYAYHRALTVLALVGLIFFNASFCRGFASSLSWSQDIWIEAILIVLLLLFWYRTKQRGMYYVREVLLSAERHLSPKAA